MCLICPLVSKKESGSSGSAAAVADPVGTMLQMSVSENQNFD